MDISIKNLKNYIFDPKTESLRLKRASEIIHQHVVITEKVDGTKLTLVRTNRAADPDYTKNWIVSYKGAILSAKEFAHLNDKEKSDISTTSVGIGQYSIIFDHLKKINNKINSIPLSTEFSIEFAQNKDTLTRTYENKGGMFLRSYGPVDYRIIQGTLHTQAKTEITDYDKVKSMAESLKIASFPVFHDGNLTKESLMKNPLVSSKLTNVDWNNPIDVISKFSEAMLSVPSSLGGVTEGVVLKFDNGTFFKLVQSDQYDAETRDAKKSMYRLDPDLATDYYQQIRSLIQKVISQIGVEGKSEEDIISDVNSYVVKNEARLEKFFDILLEIANGKKDIRQIKDDIHDTVRLVVSKKNLLGEKSTTLGLIPIAGKPLHLGHWRLIERAAKENDRVVVYTTSKSRIERNQFPIKGEDFIKLWSDIFIPYLPKNVKVKFVDSPVRSVVHELGWLEQSLTKDGSNVPTVNLYSDKDDVEANFKDEDLNKFPELLKTGKINKVGVERSSTVNISGTRMREFLQTGDKESFLKYLPPVSQSEKEEIWDTLMKNKPELKESNPYASLVNELIEVVFRNTLLLESGQSVAAVDSKTPKTFDGGPAQATTKLKIVDDAGNDIANSVSKDVKSLAQALNKKVRFWKDNNPYIDDGYIFNGSSQHLMNPETRPFISKYKKEFGDIDIIIPKTKLDELKTFLDGIDDNQIQWTLTSKTMITPNFYYVGRTKSFNSIPDQVITLFYYKPKHQIVQVDFEGDDMTQDSAGYEKPSEWTKFTKDSPYSDLEVGIKGMAGALFLRSLARAATSLGNVLVLKPSKVQKVLDDPSDSPVIPLSFVAKNKGDSVPSRYTLNTGGGMPGLRPAYKFVKNVSVDGKVYPAYRFVEAKEEGQERITDLKKAFEILFDTTPTSEELKNFRSFTGLLANAKKYLPRKIQLLAIERFTEAISGEAISQAEIDAIKAPIQKILGISI